MKKAVLFLAACLVSANAFAQEIPEVPELDESKFEIIRDLSDKTTSFGGEAPFYATEKVAVRASAHYTLPQDQGSVQNSTEQHTDDKRTYGVGVSVTFAL